MNTTKNNAKANYLIKYSLFFLIAWCFYGTLALFAANTGAYSIWSELFGTDFPRVVGDIATFGADHFRTGVHPLFVLLINPFGFILKTLVGSPFFASALLVSMVGALSVTLAYYLFQKITLQFDALLFAILLAVTSSFIFFSATPETWIFSAFGIVLVFFWIFDGKNKVLAILPIGIFSFGIVLTNIVQVCIAYAGNIFQSQRLRMVFLKTIKLGILILVISAVLALVQKVIYPSSSLFFAPDSYANENSYFLDLENIDSVLDKVVLDIENTFIYNIVAPFPHVQQASQNPEFAERILATDTIISFQAESILNYPLPFGFLAILLWLTLAGWAFVNIVSNKLYRQRVMLISLVMLLYHLGLFLFYGYPEELFLYSINGTFIVVLLVAFSLNTKFYSVTKKKILRILMFMLIITALINNLHFFYNCMMLHLEKAPALNMFNLL